jgi:choline dehydrogenase-like flavoprotein
VLACNGVGTPRLLLNSVSSAFPDGLANRSGLVGRNLMFHPYAMVLGLFDDPLYGHQGPTGCGLWSHEFYETDATRDFVRGFSFELMRGVGPVTSALWAMVHGQLSHGAQHHAEFARIWDHMGGMMAICEDLPEEHNRVTLDPERRDANGIPAPKISYTLSENSRRMLDFGIARASEVLEAAGARRVISDSPLALAGWHLMGTARMGTDPERSVVNEWGRCHDVKNLFIIDGSLFVTSGGVNPCNTIQALALYIADRIKKNLANLFD